jgi:hypothetical protein
MNNFEERQKQLTRAGHNGDSDECHPSSLLFGAGDRLGILSGLLAGARSPERFDHHDHLDLPQGHPVRPIHLPRQGQDSNVAGLCTWMSQMRRKIESNLLSRTSSFQAFGNQISPRRAKASDLDAQQETDIQGSQNEKPMWPQ